MRHIIWLSLFLSTLTFATNRFYCSGTEPFWTLVVAQDQFTFQPLNKPVVNFNPVKAMEAKYITSSNLQVYKSKSIPAKKEGMIIFQQMSCSDGLSTHKYDFQAIFIYDGTVYRGCCMRKEEG